MPGQLRPCIDAVSTGPSPIARDFVYFAANRYGGPRRSEKSFVPFQLDDAEIDALIGEAKILPSNYRGLIQTKAKSGHKERELDIVGEAGNEFRLIFRQSNFNSLDFSVILAYLPPKSSQLFRLRRFNGKSHSHTNVLESRPSMIFTSTRQPSDTRENLVFGKTVMLKPQPDTQIFKVQYNVHWPIAALLGLVTTNQNCSR